jgi:hypothetical protein
MMREWLPNPPGGFHMIYLMLGLGLLAWIVIGAAASDWQAE